jgi:hypothetical protein
MICMTERESITFLDVSAKVQDAAADGRYESVGDLLL